MSPACEQQEVFPLPLFQHTPFPDSPQVTAQRRARRTAARVDECNEAIRALKWCATPGEQHCGLVTGAQRSAMRNVWDAVRRAAPQCALSAGADAMLRREIMMMVFAVLRASCPHAELIVPSLRATLSRTRSAAAVTAAVDLRWAQPPPL